MPINVAAVAFLSVVWVFILFPVGLPLTAASMNYNEIMFGGTVIFAVVYYFARGKYQYAAPVELVKRSD